MPHLNKRAQARHLEDLEYLARVRARVEQLIQYRVIQARRAGCTWDEIAAALGIASRQAAWGKYHRLIVQAPDFES